MMRTHCKACDDDQLEGHNYNHACRYSTPGTLRGEFKKNDDGKLRWSKFAWGGAAWVMRVMTFGADKYGWDNWRKATTDKDRQRYVDAAIRHLIDYVRGEKNDRESALHHLSHAACCLLFFLEGESVNPNSKNGAEILEESNG